MILQPSYIPWRGYFHQMQKADIFVFYDDVQYDRHGWRNRNRIKTPGGLTWLTIPLCSAGDNWKAARICDMRIANDQSWTCEHFESLRHNYARAPYFARYRAMFERWYANTGHSLADFTIETTIEIARELGVRDTEYVRSSALECGGSKTERLLALLKKVGATCYLSGPAAKGYLDTARLTEAGIAVEWMKYDYPEYPQLHGRFEGQVSILDLLLMTGPEAGKFVWGQTFEQSNSV